MYAVIQTGGKQYRVSPGDQLKVEKLQADIGDKVTFEKVIMTSDGEKIQVGKPYIENANVEGKLLGHGKSRKVLVFKYKRRKNYRRKRGHRQPFSLISIENINS